MRRLVRAKPILTEDGLTEIVDTFSEFEEFAFDVETKGPHRGEPALNEVFWISLAGPGTACAIPMGHPLGEVIVPEFKFKDKYRYFDYDKPRKDGSPGRRTRTRTLTEPAVYSAPPEQLDRDLVFEALRPLFFSDRRIFAHNATFDFGSIAKYYAGEVPPPPYGDTIVAKQLLNEIPPHGLKYLVKKYWDWEYEDIGIEVEKHPMSKACLYSILDAKYNWLLWRLFEPGLDDEQVRNVFELEMDVLETLIPARLTGVRMDVALLEAFGKEIDAEMEEVTERIFEAAGGPFNVDSNPQLREFVYDIRGHEPFAFTEKTEEPSTAKGVLQAYATKDPIIKDLLEYSELSKLRGTYVGYPPDDPDHEPTGLLAQVIDGKVYTELVQYGARTGRFSSRKPNLQNIPKRTERGKRMRAMFIAPEGMKLVVADYSQIEYRVLAHYSKDPTLLKAFLEGWDPHAATAALLFGVSLDEVTEKQRDAGKTVNFATIYGSGPANVADTIGVSIKKAKKFLSNHERKFPKVYSFKKDVIRTCRARKPPYVKTITGRRRRLPQIVWSDRDLRASAERQAVNTVIQGSSADIIKIAMVRLFRALPPEMTMLLQVHDELVVQTPEDQVEECSEIMTEAMQGVDLLSVPLDIDINSGDNWEEAK